MTQEIANKLFLTAFGQQLNVFFTTSDDQIFIRRSEAEEYCHDILEEGNDPSKYNIEEWYPEY